MSPAQPSVAHLAGVFHAPVQVWSQADGSMSTGAEGVYCGDQRVMSQVLLITRQHELRHVSTQVRSATEVGFVYLILVPAEVPDPLVSLHRVRKVSADMVREELRLASALDEEVHVELDLVLGPDRTRMDQVKHGLVEADPPMLEGSTWSWRDEHTTAEMNVRQGRLQLLGSQLVARWSVQLLPRSEVTLGWSLKLVDTDVPIVGTSTAPLQAPRLSGRDRRIRRLVDVAFSDLSSLRVTDRDNPGEVFLAAGAPWFYTMFGRDALIAARLLLPADRTVAGGTLRALAARQGTVVDRDTAEQPGKILHEVRRTSLMLDESRLHLPPVYYGTIDATPLWILLLHDAWQAGMPEQELSALVDNLEAALSWLTDHGDSDGDGFLEYLDSSGHGLANQGWKDSGDAIRWHDGSLAEGPIALSEVQGYAYEAAIKGATLLDVLDRRGGDRWRGWATDLRERFRAAFWCEDASGRYPALALDREKRPVDGICSNMGHLLGTGILDPDEQQDIVARLVHPALFSGYGIRTLSATNAAYWPLRYHSGAVWTHDTAVTIDGMLRDGFEDQAALVAEGLLNAAEGFGYRLPELFGGHEAQDYWPPVPYPASCRPQAWAAASAVPVARALGALLP